MCECNVRYTTGYVIKDVPSWFYKDSGIIGAILITTHTAHIHSVGFYSCKGLLLHTHLLLKNLCCILVGNKSPGCPCVKKSGLHLSAVTAHPSTISLHEHKHWLSVIILTAVEVGRRSPKPHGLLCGRQNEWIKCHRQLTAVIIFISYFQFWVLADNKIKKHLWIELSLYLAWLLNLTLKQNKRRKIVIKTMYWKHLKKKYCILCNFDRIIFIKIHQWANVWTLVCVSFIVNPRHLSHIQNS